MLMRMQSNSRNSAWYGVALRCPAWLILTSFRKAGHLKLQALKRLFPGADEGTIRLTLQVKDFKWDATRAALAEVFPIVLQPEARPPARVSTSDVHPEDSEGPRMFPSATSALLDKMYEGIEIKFDVSADERAIGTLVTQRDNIRHRARDSYHKGQRVHGQMLSERAKDIDNEVRIIQDRLMLATFQVRIFVIIEPASSLTWLIPVE